MNVKVKGWKGIAFDVVRVEDDRMTVVMVGDDKKREVDAEDCTEISEDDFCGSCGQIGCGWH